MHVHTSMLVHKKYLRPTHVRTYISTVIYVPCVRRSLTVEMPRFTVICGSLARNYYTEAHIPRLLLHIGAYIEAYR